ncbi:sensor histidine kinase [Bacteroides sp.]|uniref:sensor histidine kinase n=1 Tax=Bacteroides sp. TaxID=29523 RepID=UPI002FC9EE72
MEKKHDKLITLLGLVAIVALQTAWLYNTYSLIRANIVEKSNLLVKDALELEVNHRMSKIELRTPITIETGGTNKESVFVCTSLHDKVFRKLGSDISLVALDSIYTDLLKKEQIQSNIIINKLYPKQNIVLESTSKEKASQWGTIITRPIPIRLDNSRAIQVILANPYWDIFERMSLLLIATVLMMIFVAGCIVYQIKIIAKQNQIARARQDFSYAMIHDMKTPLTSIAMGISMLKSGKIDNQPEKKAKHLRIMEEETEHMLKLSNKVLTLSKLESGKLELIKQEVNLPAMIENLTEIFAIKATKPIRFNTQLEAETAYADEEYLREAVSNLIDNAIKYSNESVQIDIFSKENEKDETVIGVRDNGLGISMKDRKSIFEKFERAAATERSGKGGATGFGLGLNYVQRVVEAHEGTIELNSIEGEYSEFTIHLPKFINEI